MKATDIKKLREELKNLINATLFEGVQDLEKTEYRDGNPQGVTALYEPLALNTGYYLVLASYGGEVEMEVWKSNKEERCFNFESSVMSSYYKNKTQFLTACVLKTNHYIEYAI